MLFDHEREEMGESRNFKGSVYLSKGSLHPNHTSSHADGFGFVSRGFEISTSETFATDFDTYKIGFVRLLALQ